MAQLPPATLQVLPPPPTAREATASHAVPRGLPRIVAANATSHPPPSLNSCRTAAARGPDSAPALWYWQLTGEEWLGDSHSYELAKKRWRRMPAEHKAAERSRDRSGQKRPADDSAKVAQRVRVKREAEKREAATAYRVVDMHTHVSANFASASRPPAFCAFACRIGLLSALSHTHSACLRFTEVVGCKSRCVAPCWHVPRGSKGAPPPLALERATGTASAHC